MKLWNFLRQNVKLVLKDGSIISGFVQEYCNKDDNDKEIDSIGLDVRLSNSVFCVYGESK